MGDEHSIVAAYRQMIIEVEQVLGRALGYPLYADDQKNFPGTTEADGVCVGDHVPASLADEAAREIARLRTENDGLRERQAEAKKLLESSLSLFEMAKNELVEKAAEIARLEKEFADLAVQHWAKVVELKKSQERISELEEQVDDLQGKLLVAKEWQPLPDGLYFNDDIIVSGQGKSIGFRVDDQPDGTDNYWGLDPDTSGLPDDIRLCRIGRRWR
jgi:predicted DNA-binding protein (MmcQ/YjbR family)